MTSLRSTGLALLVVASAACFADQGPHSSGAATAITATAGTTDTVTSTGASPTSTSMTDSGSSGPSECAGVGQPCGAAGCCGCLECDLRSNTCAPDDAGCPTCQACLTDGTCALAPATTPCTPGGPGCAGTVWGPLDNACLAFAPAGGTCNDAGICVPGLCSEMGKPVAACAEQACLVATECVTGKAVADVSFAIVCAVGGTTPSCQSDCSQGYITSRQCDDVGACVVTGEQSCQGFDCSGSGCAMSCDEFGGCLPGYQCNGDSCTQPAP